jgi:hypothetical protein
MGEKQYVEVGVKDLMRETEKAYLIKFTKGDPQWVPKSVTFGGSYIGDEVVHIAEWFIRKNKLTEIV